MPPDTETKKLLKIVIPTEGFSSLSDSEGPLYDPVSDHALVEELEKCLDPEIDIIKVKNHINTQEFAGAAVEALSRALML